MAGGRRFRVELLRTFDLSYDYLRRLLNAPSFANRPPAVSNQPRPGGKKCSATCSYSLS
jgi:hypothetical protein